jgi:glucose dehydrogenase
MSFVFRVLLAASLVPAIAAGQPQTAGWPVTEGAPGGGRYSPLADINTSNVGELEQAWVYRTGDGDYFDGSFPVFRGTSQETTPILVDGRLILTTPTNRVIALDPERGTRASSRAAGTPTCGPTAAWRRGRAARTMRARRAFF